ncbi:MAG: bifunctional phosphopantothenoylcysteine decarboxylase/phosphopantothenate--cysteine ligase CoaBC [Halobacteriota archaeon]
MSLEGRTVVLGVTGSIAAVECVKLIHELRRRGADIQVVTSEAATKIIHPWALEFASGNEVVTEITGDVEHVRFCGGVESEMEDFRSGAEGDLLLIAPSTANTVGKIASGVDDTPVTTFATTALGSGMPVAIAPAMHEPMYDHPGVAENLEKLESWGVEVIPPKIEEDKAKLADKDDVATECERLLSDSPLSGKRVVVTSGRTEEAVDPVRVLTTRSSGKTGREIAEEFYVRGAEVVLIHNYDGDVRYAESVVVESAEEMIDAALSEVDEGCDVFVSAAAISDYTVEPEDTKIESGRDLVLQMEKVPKLLDQVRERAPNAYLVGFKAETGLDRDDLIEQARGVMERADLDLVVANDASVMGDDDTSVEVVTEDWSEAFRGTKQQVAGVIVDTVERSLG